ncbi:hypothetical protein R1sor_000246 [Riccia sorocarpa]|uniref:Uncharacterized protein n=1 Tax=Riccia sorocarpa TaxID=122646 RepID=A0ABD3GWJ3_9MARC
MSDKEMHHTSVRPPQSQPWNEDTLIRWDHDETLKSSVYSHQSAQIAERNDIRTKTKQTRRPRERADYRAGWDTDAIQRLNHTVHFFIDTCHLQQGMHHDNDVNTTQTPTVTPNRLVTFLSRGNGQPDSTDSLEDT